MNTEQKTQDISVNLNLLTTAQLSASDSVFCSTTCPDIQSSWHRRPAKLSAGTGVAATKSLIINPESQGREAVCPFYWHKEGNHTYQTTGHSFYSHPLTIATN